MKKKNLIFILILILLVFILAFNTFYAPTKKEETTEFHPLELEGVVKEICTYCIGDDILEPYPHYFLLESYKLDKDNNKMTYIIHYDRKHEFKIGQRVKLTYDGILESLSPQIYPLTIEVVNN
ncbi:MAG: DUF1073 domain-containing protein [Ruminococcus sp.]|nr:DUF1073 domain-containing protein [Ruminococcus sp.]